MENFTSETTIATRTEHLSGAVAQELDFYRIRETVASFAVSDEGKESVLRREPSADRIQIEQLKRLGHEWDVYMHSSYQQAITAWPAVGASIRLLGVDGAQLEQDQLYALGLFCLSHRRATERILGAAAELEIPELKAQVSAMLPLDRAEAEIFAVLDSNGDVKDLPALRAIRARIAALHKEIDGAMRAYTSDVSFSGALQSNVPALKADRQLLAVRSDRRGAIKGIIHEVSASGQTLYIEPEEVVRANNELLQEEYHLQSEMRKLFRELTAKISLYKEAFEQGIDTLVLLDSTFAAARYGESVHGVFAEECERNLEPPLIRGARHPLLGSKAVPVDISFMGGKSVLVITGPNTGGKTVTLKTIALFALLNQAGFPVPADEGTRLPVFSSVFADIGDEQSIDDSLSTFSSHMKKTAEMIACADSNSLVLLDELGSGTDPQEGGAIAMATLDVLIERNAFVIVTTHHGILKNYGYTNPRCINASVDFDADTLCPTYRLLMGVPGESHAIDIALRSGVPDIVVDKARAYMATEQADVSTLIKGLSAKHEELDNLLRQERIQNAELGNKFAKLHVRELEVRQRELSLRDEERRKSSEFLRESRSKLENLVRELREGELNKEKTRGVKDFITELDSQIREREEALEREKIAFAEEKAKAEAETIQFAENGMRLMQARGHTASSKKSGKKKRLSNAEALANASAPEKQEVRRPAVEEKPKPAKIVFAPDMEVYVGEKRRRGTLVSENRDGTWVVRLGVLKMTVPRAQLAAVNPEDSISRLTPSVVIETSTTEHESLEEGRPQFELRLLGMRQEEALKALERQIDLCIIHNFRQFSIIHGKGTGVLQQAVRDYLSHYPGVKEFSFAAPEDGGTGKTYVTLF